VEDRPPAALPAGWWAPGLTLAERCLLPGSPASTPETDQRAVRRLARWRAAHELAESGQFDRRLAAAGIAGHELTALLAESPASLAARARRPGWAELVEAVLAKVPEQGVVPEPVGPEPVAWQRGFLVVVAPFIELGWERLAAAVAAEGLDAQADLAALRDGFTGALGKNLVTLASRTLVLELNVLRVTDRLAGQTPQQRFWSFVRHFAGRSALAALLVEYPVLARLLAQATACAVDSWLELLRRFAADRAAIVAEVFGGVDPGRLAEVTTGRGDTHQGGRSVAVLRFAGAARLVYKPRPLGVHVHFNECLAWLNRIVPDLDLRQLAVLDRGGYGWVEFAAHRACADRAGLARYFQRQGALLALLYTLDGMDFHFENLIASGDQPVLVDLEALLHPALPVAGAGLLAGDPALAAYERSVFRVGLLPSMVFGEDGAVLDVSGNGGDAGRALPFKVADWDGAGTDEMRLVRVQPLSRGSQNLPRLGGADVEASEFADDLLAGFGTAYDAIVAHRADLTGPDGLLRRFVGDELRVVVRATQVYGTLLHESTHPDVLRDALDRDRILDYLWAISVDDPGRERLVEHERSELWGGDVPLFSLRPDARDLFTGAGERVAGVVDESSLERVSGKIATMGPDDRRVQEWIIQAAFATRRAGRSWRERGAKPATSGGDPLERSRRAGAGPDRVEVDPDRVRVEVDPDRVLVAARVVGDQLAGTAYRKGNRVGWLGLHFLNEDRWLVRPIGLDLYGGHPGVALFLSQLALVTGEQRYADLAYDAAASLRLLVDSLTTQPAGTSPGAAFSSLAGLAYVVVHAAANLAAPELLAAVEPLVDAAATGVDEDQTLDVIGGSAGVLAKMLAVHEATGSARAREVARACADRLVATAMPQDQGVAWAAPMGAHRPLVGFSHGAAGMGWALLKYAALTGESRYAEVGLEAFRYERSVYLPKLKNWPDFRVFPDRPADDAPRVMVAWCHGAPGIGLARADCRHTHLPEVARDLELALQGLLAAGPVENFSLCHGLLGNLELLTVAAGGTPQWSAWAAYTVDMFERLGPVCGTPGGVATPGLMAGLAGIGHGLLRLGFPDRVPSVLLLQSPWGVS